MRTPPLGLVLLDAPEDEVVDHQREGMARDPVRGMMVDTAGALRSEIEVTITPVRLDDTGATFHIVLGTHSVEATGDMGGS